MGLAVKHCSFIETFSKVLFMILFSCLFIFLESMQLRYLITSQKPGRLPLELTFLILVDQGLYLGGDLVHI